MCGDINAFIHGDGYLTLAILSLTLALTMLSAASYRLALQGVSKPALRPLLAQLPVWARLVLGVSGALFFTAVFSLGFWSIGC